ncbi:MULTISPECIES: ABC transporter ATP-binding protein [Actinosynnema]|uniref:ABC transporter ATP-binding protein n=1 Tax=Actinosynnema TaxID=40566 RepID=UPI0020A615CF|nr:ABC transporter ATP-binding protein [Actinosynnema pretiosum]MCP2099315.1 ABC-2 type transport system ATP-binding protein [Actinosynnema pretiosum]
MTGTGNPAVVVSDVRKDRVGGRSALDGVSFTVAEGEFFGLLGPAGSGKTALLEVLEGLRRPDSGRVELLGVEPWPRDEWLVRRVGMRPQVPSFFDGMAALDQVMTFGALRGVGVTEAVRALDLVGLAGKLDVPEYRMTAAQRQLLSLACCLAHDPDVLLLDEPTAGLDPTARRHVWDVLRTVQASGKTVVCATGHPDEAEILCDRVAILDHGRVLAADTPAALVRGLGAPTLVILPSGEISARDAQAITGVDRAREIGSSLVIATRRPGQVLSALSAHCPTDGFQVRTPALEDVFLGLTGREYPVAADPQAG